MKLFFDMTIPVIIRYIKNNETASVSKYILSSYYLPSVPFKCHFVEGSSVCCKAGNFRAVLL